jgi:RNA polymerase sigma factor (sigma-70 family)
MKQRGQFEQLLQSHRGIVYKVAGSYSRTASDRDDLVQEICLQLWRAFPKYDSQRKFSTWMYRVALNVAISHLRRTPQSDEPRLVPLDELHLESLADPISGRQQAEMEVLMIFIGRLEPLHRALILLYLDDHSYADMAAILGISETNVATKINRIKNTLRSMNDGTR